MRRVVKQMAADGWLGIGWPKEYGGQGKSAIEQFIFFDETMRAGAPIPMLTINTVGPTIMQLRQPGAEGLASCRRSSPVTCTSASATASREPAPTSPTCAPGRCATATSTSSTAASSGPASRPPPTTAGSPYAPIPTPRSTAACRSSSCRWTPPASRSPRCVCVGESLIYAVHYDDVRVPADNLIGGENNGWKLITGQLNTERVSLCSPGMVDKMLHEVIAGPRRRTCPTGAGSSISRGCRPTSPRRMPASSSCA